MGIARPVSRYAEQMLGADVWPEADEDILFDRAHEWLQVLQQVTEVLYAVQYQRSEIFEGGRWSGSAATAANGEIRANIQGLIDIQSGLATVITWQRYVAGWIAQAKSDIADNVEMANRRIDVIANDLSMEAQARVAAINELVRQALSENAGVVTGAAEQILASRSWKPPNSALKDLLDQKIPPRVTLPAAPQEYQPPRGGAPLPIPGNPATGLPETTLPPTQEPPDARPRPDAPNSDVRPGAPVRPTTPWTNPSSPISPPSVPAPATPSLPQDPGPLSPTGSITPPSPSEPTNPARPSRPSAPLKPAASTKSPATPAETGDDEVAPSMDLAGTAGPAPSQLVGAGADEAAPASSSAGGVPMMPMSANGAGAGGGGGRSGAGSAAPVDKTSDKAGPSIRPVAANRAAAAPRAADHDKTASPRRESSTEPIQEGAAAAVIPVSAARAERDAIAEAATADAARRQGPDPLQLGRRIAAALNAPGSNRPADLGFFWITAVTSDGAIVVANSYGLAYLPDGMKLPNEVLLVSADSAVPAAERARWATYPVMAVQGWAAHHDRQLRAVIGTAKQLGNSDSGAAKVVLKPDDIPDIGDMPGRARLAVVDPSAAERLAAMDDSRLIALLPPAPVLAKPAPEQSPPADPDKAEEPQNPAPVLPARLARRANIVALPPEPATARQPVDERTILWMNVSKPLASSHPERQAVHLRAFRTYAASAREALLGEAHAAKDPVSRRAAVADWLYWKHLAKLLDAALAEAS